MEKKKTKEQFFLGNFCSLIPTLLTEKISSDRCGFVIERA